MTEKRIRDLREIANRGGSHNEKEVAKKMLTKAGIDWKIPKETILNKVKETFGVNIIKEYRIPIERSSDVLFIRILVNLLAQDSYVGLGYKYKDTYQSVIIIKVKPSQFTDIINTFNSKRIEFDNVMFQEAHKHINSYFK